VALMCIVNDLTANQKEISSKHGSISRHQSFECFCGDQFSQLDALVHHLEPTGTIGLKNSCQQFKNSLGPYGVKNVDHLRQGISNYYYQQGVEEEATVMTPQVFGQGDSFCTSKLMATDTISKWSDTIAKWVAVSSQSAPSIMTSGSHANVASTGPLLDKDRLFPVPQLTGCTPTVHETSSSFPSNTGSVKNKTGTEQFPNEPEEAKDADNRAMTSTTPPSSRAVGSLEETSISIDSRIYSIDPDLSDCESTETETESAWMSDYSSIPLLSQNHPLMLIKPIVVQEGLLAFENSKQSQQTGSDNTSAKNPPKSSCGTNQVSTTRQKRTRGKGGGSEEPRESEDDEDLPAKRSRTSKRASGNHTSFACPFAKKNPLKYRSCYSYVLKRIRDVKQHLSRFHQLPIYCPRCACAFDVEDDRDEHIRASSCLVQNTIVYEGITRAQKSLLGQRAPPKMTPSDQWFNVFDILFPGHNPRPKSAYMNVELTEELEAFQDLMYVEGSNIIWGAIRSSGLDVSVMANVEDDAAALLHAAIQEGLQQIFERWSANMPNALRDPSASRGTAAEGSSSSKYPRANEALGLSRSSSDTIFENSLEASTTAVQKLHFDNREINQESNCQLPAQAQAQEISKYPDLVADTTQPGNRRPPAVGTSLASNEDQRYSGPTLVADMGDADDLWEVDKYGECFEWDGDCLPRRTQMVADSGSFNTEFVETWGI
jgi:hypothetical protein